jgi:hypothetical protein
MLPQQLWEVHVEQRYTHIPRGTALATLKPSSWSGGLQGGPYV